ncbi:MAG: DinB family protein [Caldilineaceae bacterium]|nr:DinB family protein [Caldilineaceae bacterium]
MAADDALTTLFRHNLWANLRLLDACAGLTDEQLDATLVGTFGSIRSTLQHITLSERSYFTRISTGRPYSASRDQAPSIAEMAEMLRASGAGLIEWAPTVQPDDVVAVNWDGEMINVPKSVILTQTINHATEHRAQVAAILTRLGIEPPDMSGWHFFDMVIA